jgi:hypothetical protein
VAQGAAGQGGGCGRVRRLARKQSPSVRPSTSLKRAREAPGAPEFLLILGHVSSEVEEAGPFPNSVVSSLRSERERRPIALGPAPLALPRAHPGGRYAPAAARRRFPPEATRRLLAASKLSVFAWRRGSYRAKRASVAKFSRGIVRRDASPLVLYVTKPRFQRSGFARQCPRSRLRLRSPGFQRS